ncbi:MAG: DUF4123 domain-containing protein [Novosphingobium meiothermophilum]|uniref:DUF4123 domain-containing protein n=1 Tax=Novosphingobium TaxID=165696 RepID=UPI000D6EA511|nr:MULTISPECIES: DUF4123 domain-containing protein [Novosphingobium]
MDPVWYAIIDCAQDPRLVDLVRSCREHLCLFKGRDLDPRLLAASPWLVRIDAAEPLLGVWQQHGHGASWGLMVLSDMSIERLQRHFRRFLQARLPDGMLALFRFYDPRVFNTFIRAATPEERVPWFSGVQQFSVEANGGSAVHHYRLVEGRLFDGANLVG